MKNIIDKIDLVLELLYSHFDILKKDKPKTDLNEKNLTNFLEVKNETSDKLTINNLNTNNIFSQDHS